MISIQIFKSDHLQSCIIDAEAVAFDRIQGTPLSFQVLSTRKRKDVNIEDLSVNICVFAFDLIYLNGKVPIPLASFRSIDFASMLFSHF